MAGSLKEVVRTLKSVCMLQPAVNSVAEGNSYDIWNGNRQVRYASVVIQQLKHTEIIEDNGIIRYRFYLIYADRLVHNLEENRLEIQSNAIDVLKNIIWTIDNEVDWEWKKITYQTFTQKFADELAGAYADVEIEVPASYMCPEIYGTI